MAVECRWMHMMGGKSMKDLGKSIDYLLILVSE